MAKRRVKLAVKDDAVEWLVVKFIEDGIVSGPIKISDVFEENSENDGMEGNIQEGDKCLAPYNGKLYPAKVLRRTDEKEIALRDANSFKKQRPNEGALPNKEMPKKRKMAVKKSETKSKKSECEKREDNEDMDTESVKKKKKEIAEEKKKQREALSNTAQTVASMLFSKKSQPHPQANPLTPPTQYLTLLPSNPADLQNNFPMQPRTPFFPLCQDQMLFQTQPNIQTTTQIQPNIQTTTQTQPNIQTTTQTQPKIQTTTQTQPNIQTTTQTQPNIQTTTQTQPNIQTTTQTQPNVQTTTQTQPNIQTRTQIQPNIQIQSNIQSTSQTQSNIQTTTQTQPNIPVSPQIQPYFAGQFINQISPPPESYIGTHSDIIETHSNIQTLSSQSNIKTPQPNIPNSSQSQPNTLIQPQTQPHIIPQSNSIIHSPTIIEPNISMHYQTQNNIQSNIAFPSNRNMQPFNYTLPPYFNSPPPKGMLATSTKENNSSHHFNNSSMIDKKPMRIQDKYRFPFQVNQIKGKKNTTRKQDHGYILLNIMSWIQPIQL